MLDEKDKKRLEELQKVLLPQEHNLLAAAQNYNLTYWDLELLGILKNRGRHEVLELSQDLLEVFDAKGLDIMEYHYRLMYLLLEIGKTAPEEAEDDQPDFESEAA